MGTANSAEQFKDMEQTVQRLELYDRGVVFQKKIDDALAECSRVLEERLDREASSMCQGLEQVSERVGDAQHSVSSLDEQIVQMWGNADDSSLGKLMVSHEGQSSKNTSICTLQVQLDNADAEIADLKAKVDGTAKLMSDTPEPVTNIDLQHALERVKSYTDESVGEAKTLLNNLGLVVKNETEGLGAQVATLRAMSVPDLPEHWDEVKSVCSVARSMEAAFPPRLNQMDVLLAEHTSSLEEVAKQANTNAETLVQHGNRADEMEKEHSRFVAQQAKLQEHVSHDLERLWEKIREALVEPPELPRDLIYEADLVRLRQALEKRCNDVLSECTNMLAISNADGEGVTGKVQSLTKELESERQARQTAESEMELFRKDHQVLKKQFELTNQRVGTLIQQVEEEQEARGCLEQVVNDMIGQCASILEGQRQVVSMVNSSQQVASRKMGRMNN